MSLPELNSEISEHLKSVLKNDYEAYLEAFNFGAITSIRNNLSKNQSQSLRPVHWCKEGEYLNERPSFISDPLYHAGAYYPQEASSMFIDYVIKQLKAKQSFKNILDLSAAPGGKTLILADNFNENELIVANEVIQKRSLILKENITRWGANNVIVTNNDPEHFVKAGLQFDLILVDAPCSGEGMFRKEPESIINWSKENVNLCSLRQKRILGEIGNCLAPGGILIYSTCTFNTLENEENIQWLINQQGLSNVSIEVPNEWGIQPSLLKDVEAFRFYPHKLKGEGLFVSVLKKSEDSKFSEANYNQGKSFVKQLKSIDLSSFVSIDKSNVLFECRNEIYFAQNKEVFERIDELSSKLKVVMLPNLLGQIKGKDFIPAHALALQNHLFDLSFKTLNLEKDQALKFLKKENINTQDLYPGWYLITYNGLGLGWLKVISATRQNNYLPEEFRIRKNV